MVNLLALNKKLGCIITHKMWFTTPQKMNHYLSLGDATNNDTENKPTNNHAYYQS